MSSSGQIEMRPDVEERFTSTASRAFQWPSATGPTPSFNTDSGRKNNPQSHRSFRLTVLPSGNSIHVSAVDGMDGFGSTMGRSDLKTGASTVRSTYTGQPAAAWQRGNTTRYGNKDQPWVAKAPKTGICPVVTKKDMDATQTLTSNEEHFPSPETSPGGRLDPNRNRIMHKIGGPNMGFITHMFDDAAKDSVVAWIKSASPSEAETVLSFIEATSRAVKGKKLGRPGDRDEFALSRQSSKSSLPEIERIYSAQV